MASRFKDVTDEDATALKDAAENLNTRKSTIIINLHVDWQLKQIAILFRTSSGNKRFQSLIWKTHCYTAKNSFYSVLIIKFRQPEEIAVLV